MMTRRSFMPDAEYDRILSIYRACREAAQQHPAIVRDGSTWYQRCHDDAQEAAREYGVPFETVCWVIAALSPRCFWSENLPAAQALLAGHTRMKPNGDVQIVRPDGKGYQTLPKSVEKAVLILATNPVHEAVFTYGSKGSKTYCFGLNIHNPADTLHATIDLWMLRIIGKEEYTTADGKSRSYPHAGTWYQDTERAVKQVAAEWNETPCQTQAILWVFAQQVLKLKKGQSVDLHDGKLAIADTVHPIAA